MIENDENEFCAFQEENSESENDKISIFEDHDEESISTTVNQNHNESEETNKKDNYYEDKMLDEIEHKPNLCDIILDNLNKKRKSNSPIKITFNSSNKLHSYMNSDGLFQNGKIYE